MFTEIFFDEKVELDENSIILREYNNFDLYVETEEFICVFENKCKSMPNKSQLEEYDKKLAKIKEEKEKEKEKEKAGTTTYDDLYQMRAADPGRGAVLRKLRAERRGAAAAARAAARRENADARQTRAAARKAAARTGAGEKVPRRPGRCRGAGAALCAAAGGRGLRLCDARRKAAGKAGRDRPAAGEDGIF